MKTKINLLILLSAVLSFTAYSAPEGGMGTGGGIIKVASAPVSQLPVYITEGESIDIYFIPDNGIINVIITSDLGTEVYKKAVNTADEDSLNISISNLPTGSYIITFTDTNGIILGSEYFNIH